ncbi:N-acetylneuraminate synthase family protein [Candidatus Pelagibacter sp.]|nr:N-acetylneuraminate synthase family protein [Candidatus Pelagibacter sp.]
MSNFKISNRKIGLNYKPLIIVELGINHNGNLSIAKKIINKAKKAGAEIIKHQTHLPNFEMSEEAKKIIPVHTKDNIFKIISDCSLSESDEIKLKQYVQKQKMTFISTPFSREASDRLNKINVPAFKIGSGECNNYPLIEHICKFNKPIILSTGMNDIPQIKKAVKIIEKNKIPYALMHTTNLYPTPYNLIRLNALNQLKKAFPKAILGLSDHTGDNYTSFAAIAMGASIIEKHFIDNKKKRKGPDISASIDFHQLKDLIEGCNKIHKSIPGEKKPVKEEISTMKFAFASVVSIKDIKKGEKLSYENIWVKRPGTGSFLARDFNKLIGKIAKRNLKSNIQINKKDIIL